MSTIAKPLYKLLEKTRHWNWNLKEQNAFDTLKLKFINVPVLCAASNYGLGAVISHSFPDGSEKAIAFASRTLNSHEVNYSQVDKEGAAVIFGVKKFHQYLLGRRFTIVTDNILIFFYFYFFFYFYALLSRDG